MAEGWLGKTVLITITVALLVIVILPVMIVMFASVLDSTRVGLAADQFVGASEQVFSWEGYRYVFDAYGGWMWYSVKIALACVGICIFVAVPAGYVLVRFPFYGSRLLEELVLLPLSLPGIAMSVALLAAYNPLRGWWLVLAGHVLYTLPFMLRVVTNSLRGSRIEELEQAAASLGAGFWQRFVLVILPNLRHALILGALLVFAVSWGEFNVSYLLNSGKPQTFPAALYDTYANESFQISSAATTLFLFVVLPAAIAIQLIGGRSGYAVRQGA
ncbi:ABC transporter permease [Kaarinaea lacus]